MAGRLLASSWEKAGRVLQLEKLDSEASNAAVWKYFSPYQVLYYYMQSI